MAFPVVDTPRTEFNDQTRLGHPDQLDSATENSIPSPSKESNDLIKQIRGMRSTPNQTPRERAPFSERRNLPPPPRNEFTPLLKSATRNRIRRSVGARGKENRPGNSKPQTPAGFRDSFASEVLQLPPLNSSVIMEEDETVDSSADLDGVNGKPPHIPLSSSSAVSTPMAILPHRGQGVLDQDGNLASLREQLARLEQLDKENFSLKLKIHFLEEALRKSGKEFNEAAIKENTELKVEKVTLQRDLSRYRKSLTLAQKELDEYKKQLADYAEKAKNGQASDYLHEELDQLRRSVAKKEKELESLREKLGHAETQESLVESLKEDIDDLQQELRAREQALEELRESNNKNDDNQDATEQLREAVQEKEEEIASLQDDLSRLREKKDSEISDLHSEVEALRDDLQSLQSRQDESRTRLEKDLQRLRVSLEEKESENERLREGLKSDNNDLEPLRHQLLESQQKHREAISAKDEEIESLRAQTNNLTSRDAEILSLKDDIADLQQEVRAKEQEIDNQNDELEELRDGASAFELEQLKHKLQDRENEVRGLEHELRTRERENKEQRSELEGFKDAITGEEYDDLKQELQEKDDEIHSLQEALRRAGLENDRKLSDRDRQLEDKEDELQGLEEEIEQLKRSLREDQSTLGHDREAELERQQQQREEVRKVTLKVQEQERALAAKTEELRVLEIELESARRSGADRSMLARTKGQELQHSQEQARRVDRAVSEKDEELRKLKQDVESYQHELRSVQQQQNSSISSVSRRYEDQLDKQRKELSELRILVANHEADVQIKNNDISVKDEEIQLKEDEIQCLEEEILEIKGKLLATSTAEHASNGRELQLLQTQLEVMRAQVDEARKKVESAETTATRLRKQLATAETDLKAARAGPINPSPRTSNQERRDLHELLRDAKVRAEDLALQVDEKQQHLDAAQHRESELRAHLKRVREERKRQTHRADAAVAEAANQRDVHEKFVGDLEVLQSQIDEHRPQPRSTHDEIKNLRHILKRTRVELKTQLSRAETLALQLSQQPMLDKQKQRHDRELRGLVRQIEYLWARVYRAEAFREDLASSKRYTNRLLRAYERYHERDLDLVRKMGIDVDEVRAQQLRAKVGPRLREDILIRPKQMGNGTKARGRVVERVQSVRPSLKAVGIMVRAIVRMKQGANEWAEVEARHDELVQKLEVVRKQRKARNA